MGYSILIQMIKFEEKVVLYLEMGVPNCQFLLVLILYNANEYSNFRDIDLILHNVVLPISLYYITY